jgi:ADP-L-glycero-D-manno-heptose 6-epimerase
MQTTDTILVTGAAGMIGSALIWELNRRGFSRIVAVDRLGTDERWRNLVSLRYTDYVDADALFARLSEPELKEAKWIFHLGACSATTERDARYLLENNYDYTRRLAEWALAGGRRFVYASSAATYGDGAQGMIDGEAHLDDYRPLNAYGYSKQLFDQHALRRGWFERDLVGLKYFNIFGPNEAHKGDMRSVVDKATAQIRSAGRVNLFKSEHPDYRDGEQQRDFLYVKDAVAATLHLAATSAATGLYNVGSGRASTWIELVNPIFNVLRLPVEIDFVPLPDALRCKYQYYTCADVARLNATGWTGPRYSLAEAVSDYVVNYLVPDRRLGQVAGF